MIDGNSRLRAFSPLGEHRFIPRQINRDNRFYRVPITNTRLYYELYGTGPEKIFFCVGLTARWEWFDNQIEYLLADERLSKRFQICVYDPRGVARSTVTMARRLAMIDSIPTVVSELLWLIQDDLCWTSFHILGHSYGTAVAIALAEEVGKRYGMLNPAMRIRSLTLVSGWLSYFATRKPISHKLKLLPSWSVLRTTLKSLFSSVPESFRDKRQGRIDDIGAAIALRSSFSEEYLNANSLISGKRNRDVILERYDALLTVDCKSTSAVSQLVGVGMRRPSFKKFIALQSEWRIPVLFVSGTKDKIIDVSNSFEGFFTLLLDAQRKLRREMPPHEPLPPLRLTLFTGVGHQCLVERHQEFNELFFHDWLCGQVQEYDIQLGLEAEKLHREPRHEASGA